MIEFKTPDKNLYGEFNDAAKDLYPLIENLPLDSNIETFHAEVDVFLWRCYVQAIGFQ